MRLALALLLALVVGLGSLYVLTDGYTVVTAEGARRQSVAAHPRPLPATQVVDEQGRTVGLDADLRADGRVAIVNFFYTRCISLCLAQGSLTERLQQAIIAEGLQQRIRLISISFDPRDKAADLARYARRMGAEGSVWQFMAFARPDQARAALRVFGITVVPAPLGEFEHNAAFHVATPDGRLARVLSIDEPGLALQAARSLLSGTAPRSALAAPGVQPGGLHRATTASAPQS